MAAVRFAGIDLGPGFVRDRRRNRFRASGAESFRGRERSVTFVVAGDVPAMVDGVRRWIDEARAGWRVVDTCTRLADLVQVSAIRAPDIVVVIRAGTDPGAVALASVCAGRTVVFARRSGPDAELAELRLGADAVVPLDARRGELLATVDALLAGRSPISVEAMRLAIEGPPVAPSRELLTARQHEVLTLFAEGYSTRQIASQLTLSVNTVKTHLRQIAQRAGVSGQRMLAVHALRLLGVESEGSHIAAAKDHPWGDGGATGVTATFRLGFPPHRPHPGSEGTDE